MSFMCVHMDIYIYICKNFDITFLIFVLGGLSFGLSAEFGLRTLEILNPDEWICEGSGPSVSDFGVSFFRVSA